MDAVQAWPDDDCSRPSARGPGRVTPRLRDVSETMLWALHNRATEAARPDGVLNDPDSIKIYQAIDYDFLRHFGDPAGSLAARGAAIDTALKRWLADHPDGFIVSLGEGLETQARRVDNGRMRWLSVDLPDAISLREHFLKPTDRFRHIRAGALDPVWMDAVDPARRVFIVAQGLLMYLRPADVSRLFRDIADRFPGADMVFDVVPRWFSYLTMIGLNQTQHYRLPPMPWGIDRNQVRPTLRRWHPRLGEIAFLDYRMPRGPFRWSASLARNQHPSLIHITIGSAPCQSVVRTKQMTTNEADRSRTDTIGDMLSLATRTAGSNSDLAIASGQVIAKRVALGVAAAVNPMAADHAEFARMIPEKVEAFSAAGMAMIEQSEAVRNHFTRIASHEAMTTARATIGMATCFDPMAIIAAQGAFARAWFDRATHNFMALGMMALGAQAAAMHPLHAAVAANTERLG